MSSGQAFKIRITGPEGQRLEKISKIESVVGRSAQADIVVPNPEVSRRHAILRVEGSQVTLVDLESKNGTFLDDHQIPSGSSVVWRPGQVLRFGLAAERLQLEVQDESSITHRVPSARLSSSPSEPLAPLDRSDPSERSDPELQPPPLRRGPVGVVPTPKVEQIEKKSRASESISNFSPDPSHELPDQRPELSEQRHELSEQMRELSKQRQAIESERRSWQMQLQNMHLEKSRLESQMDEMTSELRTRLEERKESARLGAGAKLKLQNLEQDVLRLERVKDQLLPVVNAELGSLDQKVAEARSVYEKESESLRSKLAKESRESMEAVKKQAELIINEAEIKARTLKEKTQAELADLRRSQELDLSELKLKQVTEMKNLEEREEKKWQQLREQKTKDFLHEVRQKLEEAVYASQMEPAAKLRILTAVEESLHRHFEVDPIEDHLKSEDPRFSDQADQKAKVHDSPMETVIPIRRPTVHEEVTAPKIILAQIRDEISQPSIIKPSVITPSVIKPNLIISTPQPPAHSQSRIDLNPTVDSGDVPPPLWQRHRLRVINIGGIMLAFALVMVGMKIQMGRENTGEKGLAQNSQNSQNSQNNQNKVTEALPSPPLTGGGRELSSETPTPAAVSGPAPVPGPAPVEAPPAPSPTVQSRTSRPIARPSAINAAPSSAGAPSLAGFPSAAARPPTNSAVAGADPRLAEGPWIRLFSSARFSEWQKYSRRYLQKLPRVDHRKYLRYLELETRFNAGLSRYRSRTLATINERTVLERSFVREASQLLGPTNWQRVQAYRDQFLAQSP